MEDQDLRLFDRVPYETEVNDRPSSKCIPTRERGWTARDIAQGGPHPWSDRCLLLSRLFLYECPITGDRKGVLY